MRVVLRGRHLFVAAFALSAVLAVVLALTLGAFGSPADAQGRGDGNQGCTPGQVKNGTTCNTDPNTDNGRGNTGKAGGGGGCQGGSNAPRDEACGRETGGTDLNSRGNVPGCDSRGAFEHNPHCNGGGTQPPSDCTNNGIDDDGNGRVDEPGDCRPDQEEPPTDTEEPPTDTEVPPTDTEVPPTDTEVPPTDTEVPPMVVTEETPRMTVTEETPSATPSATASATPSATASATPSATASATPSATASATPSATASATPSASASAEALPKTGGPMLLPAAALVLIAGSGLFALLALRQQHG